MVKAETRVRVRFRVRVIVCGQGRDYSLFSSMVFVDTVMVWIRHSGTDGLGEIQWH